MGNESSAPTSNPNAPPNLYPREPAANSTAPTAASTVPMTETAPPVLDTSSTSVTTAPKTVATNSTPRMTWTDLTAKAKENSTPPTPTPTMGWTALAAKAKENSTPPTPTPTMGWTALAAKAKENSTLPTPTPTMDWTTLAAKAKENSTVSTPTPKMSWTALTAKAKENSTVTTPTPTMSWTNLTAKAREASTVTTAAPPPTDTPKPTFYTVAKSLTAETDKAKKTSSAYAQWYKFTKFEQKKRENPKSRWYMHSTATDADTSSPTTPTLTMTTARIPDYTKEDSVVSSITAIPTFQLRSTAIYSPPHGDRFLPGRNPLMDDEIIPAFKYYIPENKPTVGNHTKATMYQMDTISRKTQLQTQPFPAPSNNQTKTTGDNAPLPSVISRAIQTESHAQSLISSSTQTLTYEKQPTQTVLAKTLTGQTSSQNNFYYLPPQPISNPTQSLTAPSHFHPVQPASILKNSSTVLIAQDASNPLSERTHDQVLEQLRQQNKNTKDGIFRIKKVHLLEKNDPRYPPPTVSFNLPPPPPPPPGPNKASQSISRSERLFSGRLYKQNI